MAKKEEVIVDEELIRDMMRDNVSAIGTVRNTAVGSDESGNGPPEPPVAELKRDYTKRKKREETGGYADKFFMNNKSRNRVSQKISDELYDRIRRFLPVIAPDVTLTSYLNNIISDHLDQNWDEITELYNKEINKPL